MGIPTLRTERLVLRPFVAGDAEAVVALAGAREIAEMTLLIPHPYAKADAEKWIAGHEAEFAAGTGANFAIALHNETGGTLVGAIGMVISGAHQRAEIGYWVGVPFWGMGYATEAGREVVRYGFEERNLARLTAHHFGHNPASGRVLEKIGMVREGLFPRHVMKWGRLVVCVLYGVVREGR